MNPEYERERNETYWEKRRLNESTAAELRRRLETGQDLAPDLVNCPNPNCRYPLQVEFLEDRIELSCTNCGFRQVIR